VSLSRPRRGLLRTCRALLAVVHALLSLLTDLTCGHPRLVAAKLGLGGVLLSISGLVAACGELRGDSFDSCYVPEPPDSPSCYIDTSPPPPPPEIDAVTYGHDADSWQYLVELMGWAESVFLDIHLDDGAWVWSETHDLEQGPYDPDGTWDSWELDLPVVTDEADQESGSSTLFPATTASAAFMSWRIIAYEYGVVADCVVWGHNPAVFEDLDCRELEPE
jgi:hypothetical protein